MQGFFPPLLHQPPVDEAPPPALVAAEEPPPPPATDDAGGLERFRAVNLPCLATGLLTAVEQLSAISVELKIIVVETGTGAPPSQPVDSVPVRQRRRPRRAPVPSDGGLVVRAGAVGDQPFGSEPVRVGNHRRQLLRGQGAQAGGNPAPGDGQTRPIQGEGV
eukprot:1135764-Prorocentrum_minimum.AAC.1